MNLRHKKPINSYRGQANNDKNEFNDDDFKHQPSPSKKFIGSTGEQMYKYSKILAKFIINANEFYRDRTRNPKKPKTQIQHIIEEAKLTKDQSRTFKYPKRLQQPKQKRKIIPKIQHDKLQFKEPSKENSKIDSQSKLLPKEIIQTEPPKIIAKLPTPKTHVPPPQPPQPKVEPLPKQNKTVVLPPTPENYMNIYGQGIPIASFPNPAIYGNMPIGQYMGCYEEMMRLSMLQQMIKNYQMKGINLNNNADQFMARMMAHPDLMNSKQNIYQNYIQAIPLQPQVPLINKVPPIYNLTDVFLTRKQSIFTQSKQKPNQIVKHANFHVGLAYHIYLKELEKRNANLGDINQIDPTLRSRQIKEKEYGSKKQARMRSKK